MENISFLPCKWKEEKYRESCLISNFYQIFKKRKTFKRHLLAEERTSEGPMAHLEPWTWVGVALVRPYANTNVGRSQLTKQIAPEDEGLGLRTWWNGIKGRGMLVGGETQSIPGCRWSIKQHGSSKGQLGRCRRRQKPVCQMLNTIPGMIGRVCACVCGGSVFVWVVLYLCRNSITLNVSGCKEPAFLWCVCTEAGPFQWGVGRRHQLLCGSELHSSKTCWKYCLYYGLLYKDWKRSSKYPLANLDPTFPTFLHRKHESNKKMTLKTTG